QHFITLVSKKDSIVVAISTEYQLYIYQHLLVPFKISIQDCILSSLSSNFLEKLLMSASMPLSFLFYR
ncbi:hypothetical protein, partial [Bacillus toyonensis]|uniref:hypothetical protein n=1 Tax=Bacillus toyonensis TaxID=155322 RepID=UPI00197ACB49